MAGDTRNPRVQVALSDDGFAMVSRLAELSGQSRSSIISELVDQAVPVLSRMITAMEAYAAADADKQRVMLERLEAAHSDLLPDAEDVLRRSSELWDGASGK